MEAFAGEPRSSGILTSSRRPTTVDSSDAAPSNVELVMPTGEASPQDLWIQNAHAHVCCRFERGRHAYIISKRVQLTLFPLAHAVRSSPSGKLEGALVLERSAEYHVCKHIHVSCFRPRRRLKRLKRRGLCIYTRVWCLRLAMRQRF